MNHKCFKVKTLYTVLTLCAISASYLGAYASEPEDYYVESEPKRITVDLIDGYPLVGDSFIASVSSNTFYAVIKNHCTLLNKELPRGNYDVVIDTALSVVKQHSEWWENVVLSEDHIKIDDPAVLTEYQGLLAIAYELKGDWQHANLAYSVAYGNNSEEARWAEIRTLYSRGSEATKRLALWKFACLMQEIHLGSVDSVNETIRKYYESPRPADPRPLTSTIINLNDTEWRSLWKFRNNCARVICPELYFVSNKFEQSHGGRDFFELQQESYEKFVEYVEEYWGDEGKDRQRYYASGGEFGSAKKLELLRKLKTMPYRLEQK